MEAFVPSTSSVRASTIRTRVYATCTRIVESSMADRLVYMADIFILRTSIIACDRYTLRIGY